MGVLMRRTAVAVIGFGCAIGVFTAAGMSPASARAADRSEARGSVPGAGAPASKLTTIDYDGHCVAAREVGGDYYDFLDAGDRTVGFVLGDVSGKGVPAALLMANLQACFRSQEPHALLQPAHVLETVNRHFFD